MVRVRARAASFAVEVGSSAVVFNKITGMRDGVKGEGTHVCIPFIERPIIYSVRTRPKDIQTITGSKGRSCVGTL